MLVCQSATAVTHTLLDNAYIRSTAADDTKDEASSTTITHLPPWLQTTLSQDTPLTLASVVDNNNNNNSWILATERDVYQIARTSKNDDVIISQPLEQAGGRVVAVRTIANATGWMALCVVDDVPVLQLVHGTVVTTSISLDIVDDVVDFSLGTGRGLLAAFILTSRGDVYVASPVVLDGTVASKAVQQDTMVYLSTLVDSPDRHTCTWRRARAAQQYWLDTMKNGSLHVLSAPCSTWPVATRLLLEGNDENCTYSCIQSVSLSDIQGIVTASRSGMVQTGVIAYDALLPTFGFETEHPPTEASWLQQIQADCETPVRQIDVQVQADAVHVLVARRKVLTIQTTCWKEYAGIATSATTTAWTTMESGTDILGVVCKDDTITAYLADGQTVTESLVSHQVQQDLVQAMSPTKAILPPSTSASTYLDSLPPLSQTLAPVLQSIRAGLGQSTKLVGSSTIVTDISPSLLAVAVQIKRTADERLVTPLETLLTLVETRQSQLPRVVQDQQAALEKLQDLQRRVQERHVELQAQLHVISANATTLSQRATHALTIAREFVPTLTTAEKEYHDDLQRLATKLEGLVVPTEIPEIAVPDNTLVEKTNNEMDTNNDTEDQMHSLLQAAASALQECHKQAPVLQERLVALAK